MDRESITTKHILKFNGENFFQMEDHIAIESPLTIMLDGVEFATIVCTPSHLEELVVGFLASEGIIRFYKDIKSLHIDENQGFAYVELTNPHPIEKELHSKRMIGSCCGKGRQFYFHNDARTAKTVMTNFIVTPHECVTLMEKLQESSTCFKMTGGLHNAALCMKNGIVVSRTDIGRHNALDKLFGYVLMNQLPLKDKMIAFSGRLSSEVILKTAKIGVGIILSKSAPTNLALALAEELGITAVGFIRKGRLNVYSNKHRVSGTKWENKGNRSLSI